MHAGISALNKSPTTSAQLSTTPRGRSCRCNIGSTPFVRARLLVLEPKEHDGNPPHLGSRRTHPIGRFGRHRFSPPGDVDLE